MVHDTMSLGDLPTCKISKAYIKRQNSYSPDMTLSPKKQEFDLEVKVQGHRPVSMV